MYKLSFDGQPVYDPRGANETDKLIITDPAVSLAVNSAGSVSFAIYPNHPLAGKIPSMRGTLTLEDDDGIIFRGRILNDEATFYGGRKYTAEGALAYLNDSIVEPYVFPGDFVGLPGYAAAAVPSGNVVAWWLGWLLDQHNASVSADRQIKLGTVTVKDPNNYISRENSKYSNTWETVSEKLAGSKLGGYLIVRYEDDGNYLDYLAELPRTNPQRVRFAENLLDIIIKVTGENLFTAILPVGADGLTLAGLPDGPLEGGLQKNGKIIFDPAAETEYGSRITRVITWDDVTLAENLRSKAAVELSAGVRLPESLSVRACDLNGVDGVTPHFRVGQYVQVESEPHAISAAYPLLEMAPNILDPGSTVINLNTTAQKFTSQVRAAQVTAEKNTQTAVQEASKRFGEILAQSSGLYCTPVPQEDGSTIYYCHDKQTLAESTYVIKFTAQAIGFSTDGGSTYPYGFTVTGEMVAAILSANGVNADWINTGELNLERLVIKGALGGIKQGVGSSDTEKTRGLLIFGPNGLDEDGNAIPPYMILTNAGWRVQMSNDTAFFCTPGRVRMSKSSLVIPEGSIFVDSAGRIGNINYGLFALTDEENAIQLIRRDHQAKRTDVGNDTEDTVIHGKSIQVGSTGKTTNMRGDVNFTGASVSGLPSGLVVDELLGGTLSSGSKSISASGYKLYVVVGAPGSTSSRASAVIPAAQLGNRYQLADDSSYTSFTLSASSIAYNGSNKSGVIYAVYGIK